LVLVGLWDWRRGERERESGVSRSFSWVSLFSRRERESASLSRVFDALVGPGAVDVVVLMVMLGGESE
jgi:hypothetical protein